MRHSEQMKQARLVFYEDDVQELDAVLDEFTKTSQSKCAIIIDKEGHLVTKRGYTKSINTDALSALVAGSFAATREIAKQLGETEFAVLFHEGKDQHIQVSLVADRALLVIVFDDRTTLGMIRVTAAQLTEKLAGLFLAAAERNLTREPVRLPAVEESVVQEKLDEFFNN
jgi:predicted regulator of Ras-like GTPase activity (Roadblock/LC7/MglB family)